MEHDLYVYLYSLCVPILSICTYALYVYLYSLCVPILSMCTYTYVYLYSLCVPILSMYTYTLYVYLYCRCVPIIRSLWNLPEWDEWPIIIRFEYDKMIVLFIFLVQEKSCIIVSLSLSALSVKRTIQ